MFEFSHQKRNYHLLVIQLLEQLTSYNEKFKIGRIPVTLTYTGERPNLLWMKQIQPIFDETFTPNLISKFPIQEFSTGVSPPL